MVNRRWMGLLMAALPIVFLLVFVGLPTIDSFLYTFGYTGGPNAAVSAMAQNQVVSHHGPTLRVYTELWKMKSFRADFIATIWVTILSVVLLLAVSWVIALYLRFSNGWLARIASSLYLIPMFIPSVIASYALVTFWNTGGFVDAVATHLGDKHFPSFGYTLFGVVIGNVWTGLPFSVLMLASGLRNVPDSYVEAARDVGARVWTVSLKILLPMNTLPIIIVTTFSCIGVLGAYTVPYLMGPTAPQLLGVAMASFFSAYNEPQQAEAMAVMVFLLASIVGTWYVIANLRLDRKSGRI